MSAIYARMATHPDSAERDQGVLRKACLKRDDNRCVISKHYDHIMSMRPGADLRGSTPLKLEAAHIIPFSTAKYRKDQGRLYSRL
jgi:hypothetical protein